MTSNFRQFSIALDNFGDRDVPDAVKRVTQKIGIQALRGVVLKTPVDTGRARASWQTTLGSPSEGQTAGVDPGGGSTIASGTAVIMQVPAFGSVWISSNLEYIEPLENGRSQQAPNGMVAVTVSEIQSQFGRDE